MDEEINVRDEVLQYSPAEGWTQIGTMERGRRYHAIVEANLRAVCLGIRDTASSSTTTAGLNPMLALLICLLLACFKRFSLVSVCENIHFKAWLKLGSTFSYSAPKGS